jgi:nucleoside-diphosphate-sugar epimerase
MIVVFGASSNIGRRVAARLLDEGARLRLVAREPSTLDARAERLAGDMSIAATATDGAEVVISCAHARHTGTLLGALPASVRQVVLTGSTWRYSAVSNINADEVRAAERLFVASGRAGVLLHPTLIYGGTQERNLQLIEAALRRFPVFLLPGGGKNLVQPIHVDDLAACIVAAAKRAWTGPEVITVAGPAPIAWRQMVEACATSIGYSRPIIPLPLAPAIFALKLTERIGLKLPLSSGMLQRFQENACFPIERMQAELGVTPRAFAVEPVASIATRPQNAF